MKVLFKIVLFSVFIYILVDLIRKKQLTDTVLELDENQQGFINNLHDVAKPIFAKFILEVEKKTGFKVIIASGYRSFSKQQDLYLANNKNARPGRSYHNFGMAIDINLKKGDKLINMSSSASDWSNSGILEIAEKYNLNWGGLFSGYFDPVHLDLKKVISLKYGHSMDDLNTLAIAQYGSIQLAEGNKIKL